MSEIFVTSDNHFCHTNIIKYCNRPFKNVNEMKEKMIHIWNEVVSTDDYVLHLGDFILGRNKYISKITAKEIMFRLNGNKYLIIGNHDRFPKDFYRRNGIPVMKYFSDGDYMFSHYPIKSKSYDKNVMKAERYAKQNKCKYIIHGHSHNATEKNLPNHFNVCVDRHDFVPINIKIIEAYFENGENLDEK